MDLKKFISSIAKIGFSNFISLLSNVVISFFIPQILNLQNYGIYKIFTLYVGYVSLLHFGFVDGIALKYSGKDYGELNKKELSSSLYFFVIVEIIVSAIILGMGILLVDIRYRIVLTFVALNIISINITSYFQLLSQAVKRFGELALRNTINAILQVVTIVLLFIVSRKFNISYISCVGIFTFTKFFLLVWYIYTYRDICKFPGIFSFREYSEDFRSIFRNGFPITWAAMIANLILALDRQFVSSLFPTETYAIYAFAYTLFGLTLTVVQSVSTILYPMLSTNKDKSYICSMLPKMVGLIQIVAASILIAYGPICIFVDSFMQKYHDSLPVLLVIFPGVIITCAVSVVGMSFYKYLDMGKKYFKYSLITLAIAFITNTLLYFIFKSYFAIAIASIITMVIQYIIIYSKLGEVTGTKWGKNLFYVISIIMLFYGSSAFSKSIMTIIYVLIFTCFSLIFYKGQIVSLIKAIRK